MRTVHRRHQAMGRDGTIIKIDAGRPGNIAHLIPDHFNKANIKVKGDP